MINFVYVSVSKLNPVPIFAKIYSYSNLVFAMGPGEFVNRFIFSVEFMFDYLAHAVSFRLFISEIRSSSVPPHVGWSGVSKGESTTLISVM